MNIPFYKFHGTGNDFIMVDNRNEIFPKNNTNLIHELCHRRFGIGADGLILLENSEEPEEDFKMVYYNSDGSQSSMCGNGGRCLVAFAKLLGIINEKATFSAIDGIHEAIIEADVVSLKMQDVTANGINEDEIFLDTGSPHHILFSEQVGDINIKKEGANIRYSEKYESSGVTNVDFVQQTETDTFLVSTYESGVEDETYSCGTGVTAVAIAVNALRKTDASTINLETPGGKLQVSFENENGNYRNIWLTGPTAKVFKGEFTC